MDIKKLQTLVVDALEDVKAKTSPSSTPPT
jgi:hypothetical protein